MFSLHSLFDKVVLFTAREKCSGEQNRQGLMLPSALNLSFPNQSLLADYPTAAGSAVPLSS